MIASATSRQCAFDAAWGSIVQLNLDEALAHVYRRAGILSMVGWHSRFDHARSYTDVVAGIRG